VPLLCRVLEIAPNQLLLTTRSWFRSAAQHRLAASGIAVAQSSDRMRVGRSACLYDKKGPGGWHAEAEGATSNRRLHGNAPLI
jgi:hypothetical protein